MCYVSNYFFGEKVNFCLSSLLKLAKEGGASKRSKNLIMQYMEFYLHYQRQKMYIAIATYFFIWYEILKILQMPTEFVI